MTLTDGRLGADPSSLLMEHVTEVELADELDAADVYVQIDLAHTLMLTRQGIFSEQQGAALSAALLRLLDGADPAGMLGRDPGIGTITLHLERYLERECGRDGLDIQRARSRIDQNATALRMVDRAGALAVLRALVSLADVFATASETYDAVPVPGYTHLQHAQPTTLGHYFNAYVWTTARNLSRHTQNYARFNLCSLGGAAHSGTSWPIDRSVTAAYLGFDGPIPNARDAGMSALDSSAELAAALGLTLSGASRCASDLYFWSSSEVGLVRLHPSLCGTSSMMPQKRNPIALERIRALAGEAAGWGSSQLGMLHFASSTDADQSYVRNRLPGYCAETVGALQLLGAAVEGLEVDIPALRASAGMHGATTSALVDELVLRGDLSFREAHDVVARLVAAVEEEGRGSGPALEDVVSRFLPGHGSSELAALLSADGFIESRSSWGGTSPDRREELRDLARDEIDRHSRDVRHLDQQLDVARQRLLTDARRLAATSRTGAEGPR